MTDTQLEQNWEDALYTLQLAIKNKEPQDNINKLKALEKEAREAIPEETYSDEEDDEDDEEYSDEEQDDYDEVEYKREYIGNTIPHNFHHHCNLAARWILQNVKLSNPVVRMGSLKLNGKYIWGGDYKSVNDFYCGGFRGHFWVEDGDTIYDIDQTNNTLFKIGRGDKGYKYIPAHSEIQEKLINHYVGGDEERMKSIDWVHWE